MTGSLVRKGWGSGSRGSSCLVASGGSVSSATLQRDHLRARNLFPHIIVTSLTFKHAQREKTPRNCECWFA